MLFIKFRIYCLPFFLLSLLFGFGNAYCQEKIISVSNEYTKDTAAVNQLLKQAFQLREKDPVGAASLYQLIIKRSKELKFHQGVGAGYAGMAYMQSQSGLFFSAIQTYHLALQFLRNAKDKKRIGSCLINLGHAYDNTGQKDSASIYYFQAVGELEGTENHALIATAYNNLAVLMGNFKKIDKKIDYINKALAIGRSYNDTAIMIKALCDKASTQRGPDSIAKATRLVQQAVAMAEAKGNPRFIAEAYCYYAYVLKEDKKIDAALWAAKNAISNAKAANDHGIYIYASISLSDILNDINRQEERAIILKSLIQDNEHLGILSFKDELYQKLADASFKLGQFKEAFEHHQKFVALKDSILGEKNKHTLYALDAKYQSLKKDKALTEKKLELQKSQQYTVYGVAAAFLALLLAALIGLQYRNRRKVHFQQLHQLKQEKEIQLLQALMQGEEKERSRIAKDLHDGIAGMLAATKMQLSSLSIKDPSLSRTDAFIQAVKLLDESSKEVRLTSHNLMPEVLTQNGLEEAIRRYCRNISNSHLLQIHFESWGGIKRYVNTFELSLYRIVQELLNNIIKHSKATEATVQLSTKDDVLFVFIEDNGIGFQSPIHKEGMGLQSLQSRIKAMNGRFEVESSDKTGVSAYLEFNTMGLEAE